MEPSGDGQELLRGTSLFTSCKGHTNDMPCDNRREGLVALEYSSGSRTSRAKSSVSEQVVMVAKVWPVAPVAVEVYGLLEMRLIKKERCLRQN